MNSSQARPTAQAHAPTEAKKGTVADVVLGTMGNVPALIPEGEYSVGFVRASKNDFMGRERIFAWFRIVTLCPYHGVELYRVYPCPSGGGTTFSVGSNLVADAIVALGQRPKRRDRITTRMFEGKVFRVRVCTVVRNAKGKERPEADRYSKIDELLFLEAGAIGTRKKT